VFPLEMRLKASSPIMQQCFLQFLAASFQSKFVSSIIRYTAVGRYTSDFNCPLVSADIICLFCYLQQFMVQVCIGIIMIILSLKFCHPVLYIHFLSREEWKRCVTFSNFCITDFTNQSFYMEAHMQWKVKI
jgi:hypothetical protein